MNSTFLTRVDSVATSASQTHLRDRERLIFLNTSDILLGEILHRDYSLVENWPGQAKKSLKKGDILFSEIRPANGRWAFIDFDAEDFVVSTKLMVIRAQPGKILPKYLYYFLTSSKITSWLQHLAESRSGTFPQITFDQVGELEIPLPSMKEQELIVSLLDTIENKIDLNRRMNETLEAMARALFKDWFVNFGPTRAKIEGRPPYLAPDLWSLFPDRLDSEGTPDGWRSNDLVSVTSELRRGISPTYVDEGGTLVLNQKCIRDHIVSFGPARRHDHTVKNIEGREILVGDILVNSTGVGTLGRVAQIWSIEEPMVVDGHVTVVRANNQDVSAQYLGINLMNREVEIEKLGEGSTGQTELSRSRLGTMKILIPSRAVLNAFDEEVGLMIEKLVKNQKESHTLAQMRDLLLPKLMSGEIRLHDAEKTIGEAL